MRRFSLFLLSNWIVLAANIAYAQPVAENVCDGMFERFLKGYTLADDELTPFIDDTNAVAACRRKLDLRQQDHLLIEALLRLSGPMADATGAKSLFDTACAQGRALGCGYAILIALAGETPRPDATEIARRFEPLLASGLPLIETLIAALRIPQAIEEGPAAGPTRRLLQSASDKGDHEATRHLYALAMVDLARGNRTDPRQLLIKAAAQGDVPAILTLAQSDLGDPERPGSGNPEAAFGWYMRATEADHRWFRLQIAEAHYELSKMLREGKGTSIDTIEADRRLQRAAELGHEPARLEVQKK